MNKTDTFINKARKVHGDEYDYSNVEYINAHTKVDILCPEHGEFWQTPNKHLSGHGCPKCGAKRRSDSSRFTTKDFIEKSRQIHKCKYDYSKVEYKDSNSKVCIICPKHGEFWQVANNHLQGQGCPKCYGRERTTEGIVNEFKQVHGDKYDYSKVEYINISSKVHIICPEHGEFWQTPHAHLKGNGCPKCGIERVAKSCRHDKNTFIQKAALIHGNRYDYSNVEYVNAHTPVLIKCSKHGEFWQTPNKHLSGQGCSRCRQSILEEEVSLFLDSKNIEYIREYTKGFEGLRCDFFLPYYNYVIECQGDQHFQPNIYSIDFEYTINRDLKKQELAKYMKYHIIYYTKNIKLSRNCINNPIYKGIYTENNLFHSTHSIYEHLENKKSELDEAIANSTLPEKS